MKKIIILLLFNFLLSDIIYYSIPHSMVYSHDGELSDVKYLGTLKDKVYFNFTDSPKTTYFLYVEDVLIVLTDDKNEIDFHIEKNDNYQDGIYYEGLKNSRGKVVEEKKFFNFLRKTSLFSRDERFIEKCNDERCGVLYLSYPYMSKYSSYDTEEFIRQGLFIGYSHNLFNVFKKKKIGLDIGFEIGAQPISLRMGNVNWDDDEEGPGGLVHWVGYNSYEFHVNSLFLNIKYDMLDRLKIWIITSMYSNTSVSFDRSLGGPFGIAVAVSLKERYSLGLEVKRFPVNNINHNFESRHAIIRGGIYFGYKF